MGRFRRSWELVKASWTTLKADKELLLLPVLSFLGALLAFGAALAVFYVVDYDPAIPIEEMQPGGASIAVFVIASIVVAIVATYFQAAMVAGAWERLSGGDPTVGSAMSVASSRLGVIVPWALFSWTVGTILRMIEENAGQIGAMVIRWIGMAFRVVTFLAVPILVFEQLGPIDTLKRSGQMFKQTWGENLAGSFGIGIVTMLAVIPIIALAALAGAVGGLFAAVIVAVPLLGLLIAVTTSLTAIYQTVLYNYAVTGQVDPRFNQVGLPTAFVQKS